MPISFACSKCGKRYSVQDAMVGKTAQCACGEKLVVPAASSPAQTTPQTPSASASKDPAPTKAPPITPVIKPQLPSSGAKSPKPGKPKSLRAERGAHLRGNLRRSWKLIVALGLGWCLLCVFVIAGAVTYGMMNDLSPRRMELLAQGCGQAMVVLLAILTFGVLLMASRKKKD